MSTLRSRSRPATGFTRLRYACLPGALALLLCALFSPSASAEIYAFRDHNGVMQYTNMPSNDRRYKPVPRDDFTHSFRSTASYFVDAARRQQFAPLIEAVAAATVTTCSLKPELVHAVVTVESGYQAAAVSPKGAVGLMQLMPETAKQYGVANRRDPQQNLRGGTRYLCDLLALFNNDLSLALAAYNAGPNAVNRYKGIPPYEETRNYVELVLEHYRRYRVKS